MNAPTQSVDILLATYNGGRFLAEQLRSIEQQTCSAWRIIARDDGSTDNTPTLLAEFQSRHPADVILIVDDGTRLGATGNFHRLLQHSTAEHVMFCDQDDVWCPTKIECLLQLIRKHEREGIPLLIHSDLAVVDQNLEPIASSLWQYQFINPANCQYSRLLVQNVVTGCACIFNAALRRAALPIPAEAIMHDWWLALVAAATGEIYWTSEVTVLYRQHGGNDTGVKHWSLAYVLGQGRKFLDRQAFRGKITMYQKQAAALARHDGLPIAKNIHAALQEFASLHERRYPVRVGVLLRHEILKTGLIRNLALLVLI